MKEQSYMFFKKQSGFTLIELIIVTGIILLLFGFVVVNLLQEQHIVSVNSSVDILISDMASQQTKAMAGDTNGSFSQNSYGIYFESDRYTLFKGNSFSAIDLANFTVMLDENIAFNGVTFPNNIVVFSALTGEVNGFIDGNNTIAITNSQGTEIKTITINRYGVVKSIN
mgnify:CR=1 FL=1